MDLYDSVGNNLGAKLTVTNYGAFGSTCSTGPSKTNTVSIGVQGILLSGWEPPGTYTGTFSWVAHSAGFADVQGTASITITLQKYIQSITISRISSSLNFGEIFPHVSLAGSVTLDPTNGSRSSGGGATLGSNLGVALPSFTVSGEPNTAYKITLPAGFTITAGGFSMPVVFSSNPSGTGMLGPGTPTTGSQTLTVGGTLTVGANQTAGNYSRTFSVIVSYF